MNDVSIQLSQKSFLDSNQKTSLSEGFSTRSTAEIFVPWLLGNLRQNSLYKFLHI